VFGIGRVVKAEDRKRLKILTFQKIAYPTCKGETFFACATRPTSLRIHLAALRRPLDAREMQHG
tara:strand:+ start:235 stop:426 length:192 start_codon:yes stop_codon:yes gene_type:complete